MTIKKHFRRVLAGAMLAAGLASQPAAAQTPVTIGTALDPNLAAQIIIADKKGFFEAAGLDAKIEFFPSGGDLMAAFVGGSVDIGSSGSTPTMTLRSRPFPVKIISQVADISGAQQVIVGKDVATLKDLEGKQIGLLRGTASEALFLSVLKDQGVSVDSFKLVNLGPSEMMQAFVRGDVAAVALWEPFTTRIRSMLDGAKTLASGTTAYYNGTEEARRVYGDHAVMFAGDDYVAANADTVKAVLSAMKEATAFMSGNADEAIAILAEAFSLEPAQMAAIASVNEYTLRLDETMVSDMNSLAAFLKANDRITDVYEVQGWIDPAPLSAVDAGLVQLK